MKFNIENRFEAEIMARVLKEVQQTRKLGGAELQLLEDLQKFIAFKLSQI